MEIFQMSIEVRPDESVETDPEEPAVVYKLSHRPPHNHEMEYERKNGIPLGLKRFIEPRIPLKVAQPMKCNNEWFLQTKNDVPYSKVCNFEHSYL